MMILWSHIMNKTFLSKSRYCQCVQCEKILWLNEYCSNGSAVEDNEAIFETGRKVGELAKGLFGDYEDVKYDKRSNMIKKTDDLL